MWVRFFILDSAGFTFTFTGAPRGVRTTCGEPREVELTATHGLLNCPVARYPTKSLFLCSGVTNAE